jgi:hypothetical protein
VDKRPGPTMLDLVGIGGTAAACVGVGVGVGYWIGSAVHAETAFVFCGLALGVVAAVVAAYTKIKRYL